MEKFPEGWILQRLKDIANVEMGQSPPGSSYNHEKNGLPFFQGKAEFGKLFPKPSKYCDSPIKIADKNDILLSVRAPVGPTNFCPFKSCIGRGLAGIRAFNPICQKLLFFYFRNIENWMSTQGTGSTFKAISKGFITELQFPLPPLAEQQRIAAKLDGIMPRIDAVQERLSRIPKLLKRFRQSVLTAAVTGKLTEKWREEHPEVESAEILLKKTLSEINNKIINKQKRLFLPTDDNIIPPSPLWCNTHITALLDFERKGIKTGPFGSALKKHEHKKYGVPVLGIENIGMNKFIHGNKIFITKEKANELKAYDVRANDIIISRSGTVGELCVVPPELDDARISTNLIRIALNEDLVNSNFLTFFFYGSPIVLRQLKALCSGSTREFLNQKILNKLIFYLPPLPEQEEIVRQVDKLFSFADKLETHYEKAKAKLEKLPQSVLSKAFRGQLVPTEAELARREGREYESASQLLERIQAEKARLEAELKQNKKKQKKVDK